jgi:hypothetical protein
MTDKHSQEWRSRREIPNPQIKDAADQYEIGEGPADVDAGPCATGPRVAHRRGPGAMSGDEARAARSSRVAGSSTHQGGPDSRTP